MASFLINFYPYDAEAVEAGTRRQVILAPRNDDRQIRVGDNLKLYQSLRASYGRLIKEARCAEVLSLELDFASGHLVIDGAEQDEDALHDLAVREGYVDGWHLRHQLGAKCRSTQFKGFCVRW